MNNNNDLQPGEEILPDLEEKKEQEPPEVEGAQSISGHIPNPSTDDNVSDTAEKVGLYTENEPGENPDELNVAEELEKAEESRRDEEDINLGPAVK